MLHEYHTALERSYDLQLWQPMAEDDRVALYNYLVQHPSGARIVREIEAAIDNGLIAVVPSVNGAMYVRGIKRPDDPGSAEYQESRRQETEMRRCHVALESLLAR